MCSVCLPGPVHHLRIPITFCPAMTYQSWIYARRIGLLPHNSSHRCPLSQISWSTLSPLPSTPGSGPAMPCSSTARVDGAPIRGFTTNLQLRCFAVSPLSRLRPPLQDFSSTRRVRVGLVRCAHTCRNQDLAHARQQYGPADSRPSRQESAQVSPERSPALTFTRALRP